jgi:hypothetical protein
MGGITIFNQPLRRCPLPLPSLGLSAGLEALRLIPKDNEKTKSRKGVG